MYPHRQKGKLLAGNGGPPFLLLLLAAFALVLGVFFLLQGLRSFSPGVNPASLSTTRQAQAELTEIASENVDRFATQTARPTTTPIPPCQEFTIRTTMANVRSAPDLEAEVLDRLPEGTTMCVIQTAASSSEWHLIDLNPNTRRIETAYMHHSVLRAVNPTPRPSATLTPIPLATITPRP